MNKRWIIVMAAVGIHICIGAVYAWSVFTKPIMQYMNISLRDVQFAFSLAILFLGFSASFLGGYVEKYGAKKSGYASMMFYVTGMAGTGLAIYLKNIWLLYLFYGAIGGIGLGIGYITPVGTLVKWFPRNRGFATGCAIMGFGFAAMVAGPLIQYLIKIFPLYLVPVIMAGIYMVIMTLAASQFELPTFAEHHAQSRVLNKGYTAKQALGKWQFYALWLMLFINIFCGIAIISIASPMAQEMIGMDAMAAAAMVGFIGLFNGLGRIWWSSVSDYIGRPNTYILFFLIQIVGFYFLSDFNVHFFTAILYMMMTCYGGGFAAIPAYISDVFGVKSLSSIHGHVLTAWGLAGLFAPMFLAWLKELTNSYVYVLYTFIGMYTIALVVAIYTKYNYKLVLPDEKKEDKRQMNLWEQDAK